MLITVVELLSSYATLTDIQLQRNAYCSATEFHHRVNFVMSISPQDNKTFCA